MFIACSHHHLSTKFKIIFLLFPWGFCFCWFAFGLVGCPLVFEIGSRVVELPDAPVAASQAPGVGAGIEGGAHLHSAGEPGLLSSMDKHSPS